jgi:hypothetical protein
MDKKIAGLLGAVGAFASLNAAQAAVSFDPTEVLKARSYSDLLKPMPNAMAALKAIDSMPDVASDRVQLAQYHHHHHHHAYRRDRRIVVMPRRHHHHHHHHHHGIVVR